MSYFETVVEKVKDIREGLQVFPIRIVLRGTLSEVNVFAERETIEGYYGNVNQLVHQMIHPLPSVERIEVELYDPIVEEMHVEVTYDRRLEEVVDLGERVVLTYDFNGIFEEERGYIGKTDGWLPSYTGKKQHNSTKGFELPTDCITKIETLREYRNRNFKEKYKQLRHDPEFMEKNRRNALASYYKRKEIQA